MLDTASHMLLLLHQVTAKKQHPTDASFLPLSLSTACLLRQLPAGLSPPSGGLSFHQLDRLPQDILERKLAAMLLDDPLRAFTFVCALVKYTKVARALLTLCHDHINNRISTAEATQSIVQVVVEALSPLTSDIEDEREEAHAVAKDTQNESRPSFAADKPANERLKENAEPLALSGGDKSTTDAMAPDPAGIMRRAVGRDVGDGSSVLEIMKKFPTDGRIQSHGVRALKGVIRSVGAEKTASLSAPDGNEDHHVDSQSRIIQEPEVNSAQLVVETVIAKMKQFPESLTLQRDGLLCLAEYANQADEYIAIITSSGGINSLIHTMVALPDDESASIAGLSVLAHPKIADESVVHVNPESRRLVLSTMARFPLNEQVQGLSCLALANLSLRQDASMSEIVSKGGLETVVERMKRFSTTALVQAAGCWFIAIISEKNDEMKTACLDAGALPACEKARLRFPDDSKVQQYAVQAIRSMLPGEIIDGEQTSCGLQ